MTGAFAERSIELQLGCIRLHCPPEFNFFAVVLVPLASTDRRCGAWVVSEKVLWLPESV